MKTTLAAVLTLLLAPGARAATLETLKLRSNEAFLGAHASPTALGLTPIKLTLERLVERPPELKEPVLLDPKPRPVKINAIKAEVGRMNLPKFLDSHRDMFTLRLGANDWDVSVAGDAGFQKYYLTFARGDTLLIRALGDLNRLRGRGIDVRIDDKTAYNFKVAINIFNPVRGSTMKITPIQGTRGPRHRIKTGKILDRVREKSYVFKASGKEYWGLYGTDVDPVTETLGDTRSFLFINEAGMSTKAWPLAETKLPIDQPTAVDFEGTKLVLVRTAGELIINSGR